MTALEAAVANGETSPGIAAQELVQQFLNGKKGQT
jgi:hypothetical protein